MNSPTRFKPAGIPAKKAENITGNITGPITENITDPIAENITDPIAENITDGSVQNETTTEIFKSSEEKVLDSSKYPVIANLSLVGVNSRLKKLEKIINKGELPIGHIALRCLDCGKNLVAASCISHFPEAPFNPGKELAFQCPG